MELSDTTLELVARVACLWATLYGTALAVLRDADGRKRRGRLSGATSLGAFLLAAAATTFVTLQWLA